jgi:hypothetical protein
VDPNMYNLLYIISIDCKKCSFFYGRRLYGQVHEITIKGQLFRSLSLGDWREAQSVQILRPYLYHRQQ